MSVQPGVAYGDLHFPGCPFSPGLLPGLETTRTITAAAVLELAWWGSEVAVVGYFTYGFDTVCCDPLPAAVLPFWLKHSWDVGRPQLPEDLAVGMVRQARNPISTRIPFRTRMASMTLARRHDTRDG